MIDRRGFLRLAAGAGPASLAAACGWDGGNAIRPALLDVSRLNDWVGEKILFSAHRLAPQDPGSWLTSHLPNHFRSPVTPPVEDPATWRLLSPRAAPQPQLCSP